MNRYSFGKTFPPRPIMKIIPAPTDILHTLKHGERLDNLSFKYYTDSNLSWLIMAANPEWQNEFFIPFGTIVRVPYPLSRVFTAWQIQDANTNQNTSSSNSNSQ